MFEVPVDLQLSKGFRRAVLTHLLEIPYGVTESYTSVARSAGNPGAVRAAGSACATNPIPLVVPCHRVVRSDGTYGQYRGGTEAKHLLLTTGGDLVTDVDRSRLERDRRRPRRPRYGHGRHLLPIARGWGPRPLAAPRPRRAVLRL